MSGMGEAIADFIKGLYWLVGILAGLVVGLVALIIFLLLRG